VVHTHTRKSGDDRQSIDQDKLLETALTMNPDVIVVSEMKGKEANAAQEASRTAHSVLTTTHAGSCRATYKRMVTLCKKAISMIPVCRLTACCCVQLHFPTPTQEAIFVVLIYLH